MLPLTSSLPFLCLTSLCFCLLACFYIKSTTEASTPQYDTSMSRSNIKLFVFYATLHGKTIAGDIAQGLSVEIDVSMTDHSEVQNYQIKQFLWKQHILWSDVPRMNEFGSDETRRDIYSWMPKEKPLEEHHLLIGSWWKVTRISLQEQEQKSSINVRPHTVVTSPCARVRSGTTQSAGQLHFRSTASVAGSRCFSPR